MPPLSKIPGAGPSSYCQLVIHHPTHVTGSARFQAFDLGLPFDCSSCLSFWSHPWVNQYRGTYHCESNGDCKYEDVKSIPCKFDNLLQLILRPQNTDDYIFIGSQTSTNGVFVEVYN